MARPTEATCPFTTGGTKVCRTTNAVLPRLTDLRAEKDKNGHKTDTETHGEALAPVGQTGKRVTVTAATHGLPADAYFTRAERAIATVTKTPPAHVSAELRAVPTKTAKPSRCSPGLGSEARPRPSPTNCTKEVVMP